MAGEARWIWAVAVSLAAMSVAEAQGRRPWIDPPPGFGEAAPKQEKTEPDWPDERLRRRLPVLAQVDPPPALERPQRAQSEPATTGAVARENAKATGTETPEPRTAERPRERTAPSAEPRTPALSLFPRPSSPNAADRGSARRAGRNAPAGRGRAAAPEFLPRPGAQAIRPLQNPASDWGADGGRHSGGGNGRDLDVPSETGSTGSAAAGPSGGGASTGATAGSGASGGGSGTSGGSGSSSSGGGGSTGGGSTDGGASGGTGGDSSGGGSGETGGDAGGTSGGSTGGSDGGSSTTQ